MKKVTTLAAMLAIMLAMVAAPALAQDGNDVSATNNCDSIGGTAIADASGGEANGIAVATAEADANQYAVNSTSANIAVIVQYANAEANANGGTAIADASGGDVTCIIEVDNRDIVTGDSVVVGGIDFNGDENGDEFTVFKDEADMFFIIAGHKVIPVNKQDIVFGTKKVARATASDTASANNVSKGIASKGTASATGLKLLPETGGVSLITLGSGALLLAGGLLARRIIR